MSASDNWVFMLLMSLGRMFPMFVVWFAGLAIAVVRWPRCPGVSLMVIAATVVAGVTSLGTQVIFTILPRYGDTASFAQIAGIVGFASAFVHAAAWGCMIAAAFMGRNKDKAT
jgi:hypothetical protein